MNKEEIRKIQVKYHDSIPPIQAIPGGDWIDLAAAKTVVLYEGSYQIIPLGVSMKLPDGYEAHIVPRSSTFKHYGILQTNGMGIIDNSYCGENDVWGFPAYATRDVCIAKGERICQFRIVKKMEPVEFETVEHMEDADRGGFGSTGR